MPDRLEHWSISLRSVAYVDVAYVDSRDSKTDLNLAISTLETSPFM